MKVLFIDNFDSFTYNIVDEFLRIGTEVLVYRNSLAMEELTQTLHRFNPDLIVLGPGPSGPDEAGICLELLRKYHQEYAILGICLGHQCIVQAFGGRIGVCREIYHGRPSMIDHYGAGLFNGLPQPLQVGRYHSLDAEECPEVLAVTAEYGDVIMAVQHRALPIAGLQFHPESILTPYGRDIIRNAVETLTKDNEKHRK